jgi:hypothetical protein
MPDSEIPDIEEETTVIRQHSEAGAQSPNASQHKLIDSTVVKKRSRSSIVYYILDVIEIILGLRLLFKLLGANAGNAFVDILYAISGALLAPFTGIFRPSTASGSVLEWSTIIAMLIYALVAYLIVKLVRVAEKPKI